MILSKEQFSKALRHATKANIDKFYEPLALKTMPAFQIITPNRIAMFLAQVAHESGSLRYVKELASGAAYDTGKLAKSLGNTLQADGDGQKYKGRGLIQLTGHENYKLYSEYSGIHFLENPQLLELPEHASNVSGWFWDTRKLNKLADLGTTESFEKVTRVINGGVNGLADRLVRWSEAKAALGI